MRIMNVISLIWVLGVSGYALGQLLPEGVSVVSGTVSQSNASKLWIGDDESDFPGGLETTKRTLGLYFAEGISGPRQIEFGMSYAHHEITEGESATENSHDGVQAVQFGMKKSYFADDVQVLNLGVGVRAAGDDESADRFLAINDGATKYDLVMEYSRAFSGFSLESIVKYTIRPNKDQGDQVMVDLGASFSFGGVGLTPFLSQLSTLDGPDLGDEEFSQLTSERGSSAYSTIAESYLVAGLRSQIQVGQGLFLAPFVQAKIQGKNTEKSTSFGLSLAQVFVDLDS